MSKMAMFDTPIGEITKELLLVRLLFAFRNWIAGEISSDKVEQFQSQACRAVSEYFADQDHGILHSRAVYKRALEIAAASPKMIRETQRSAGLNAEDISQLFTWSAVLHDMMRFFGFDTPDHEQAAAELARSAFSSDGVTDGLVAILCGMVVRHDYLCPLIDGEDLPPLFPASPAAEIFRLADKTSQSPAMEIDRWWHHGEKIHDRFFRPQLSDEVRFDPSNFYLQGDQLTNFLPFFAMQPKDFYAFEAAEAYRRWSSGKVNALARILAIARGSGSNERAVLEVILRFYKHFRQEPHCLQPPEGIENLRIYQEIMKGKT